jgi:hypothetical protein
MGKFNKEDFLSDEWKDLSDEWKDLLDFKKSNYPATRFVQDRFLTDDWKYDYKRNADAWKDWFEEICKKKDFFSEEEFKIK